MERKEILDNMHANPVYRKNIYHISKTTEHTELKFSAQTYLSGSNLWTKSHGKI